MTRVRLKPEAWAARRGIHYGWVIVAVVVLMVFTGAGARALPGVMIRPLEAEFGWSRGQISLAFALSLLTYGLGAPLSARVVERLGLRGMTLAFLGTAGVGVALTAAINHLWQLHLFWGLVVGFGTAGIATVMGAMVANVWFELKRGLVTGMVGAAASGGQLVFLPLLVFVTATWGWRPAIGLMAALLLGLLLPLVFVLMRSRPADVGLRAYGSTGREAAAGSAATRATSMRQALRTRDFWLLSATFFVCGFTTVGLIGPHFLPHAVEHGFSEAQAAGILSAIGALNVAGTVTSGWLCDRYPPRVLLACYYFFRALSLLALPFITTLPLMSVFAIVFGLDYIATVPPTVMLTAERFGRQSVGTVFGWISFAHMLGGAIASYVAGFIHDAAGEYTLAFYLAGVLGLLAAAMAFGIRGHALPRAPEAAVLPAP